MSNIVLPGLGVRLAALRRSRGLKQREMAELLDCTVQHYQRIEYGKVNLPSTTLMLLADHFDVTTDYLLGREEGK